MPVFSPPLIRSAKKTVRWLNICSQLSILLVCVLFTGHAAQALVVDPSLLIGDEESFLFREATTLDTAAEQKLADLMGRVAVTGVDPVRVNLSALIFSDKNKGQPIAFNVGNTKALHLKIASRKKLGDGSYIVHAVDFFDDHNHEPGQNNEATFIVSKQNIFGIIRGADGQVYELEALGGENYVLIHIDPSQFPPEDHPSQTVDVYGATYFDWWSGQRNFFAEAETALKAGKLSVLTHEPTAQEVKKIAVSLPLLSDSKRTLNLNLATNINLPVMFVGQESTKNTGYIWRGKIINSRNGSITLSVNGKKMTGIIRTDTDTYLIEPIANEKNIALVKMNLNSLPPEHPAGYHEGTETGIAPAQYDDGDMGSTEDDPLSSKTTIKVLVAYTSKAKQAVADINSHINIAVSEANQSYVNSGIPIELKLVHTYETGYTESDEYATDLKRFRVNGDNKMDGVHAKRTKYKADIAVLMVDNNKSCGLASAIMAKSSAAFAIVNYACAIGNYSFAHEIGHLQGARHDKESGISGTDIVCKDSAYGYLNAASGWRTIMAYDNSGCINKSCIRIPFWSNPVVNYQNHASGELNKNNAACLTTTRKKVAKFK